MPLARLPTQQDDMAIKNPAIIFVLTSQLIWKMKRSLDRTSKDLNESRDEKVSSSLMDYATIQIAIVRQDRTGVCSA